jgi:hypothetical protein
MADRLRIVTPQFTMDAVVNETETARALREVLPCEAPARRWGDEVYFEVPLEAGPENPQPAVPAGTVAYWPPGHAFCIFFGQTPASPVNVVGVLDGDAQQFAGVRDGETIRLELTG